MQTSYPPHCGGLFRIAHFGQRKYVAFCPRTRKKIKIPLKYYKRFLKIILKISENLRNQWTLLKEFKSAIDEILLKYYIF
jgi:hypothetical protein